MILLMMNKVYSVKYVPEFNTKCWLPERIYEFPACTCIVFLMKLEMKCDRRKQNQGVIEGSKFFQVYSRSLPSVEQNRLCLQIMNWIFEVSLFDGLRHSLQRDLLYPLVTQKKPGLLIH